MPNTTKLNHTNFSSKSFELSAITSLPHFSRDGKENSFTNKSYLDNKANQEIDKRIKQVKHNLPSNEIWISSTYSYNKTYSKLAIVADSTANNFIRNYFDLTPLKGKKKSKRVAIRFKRLSLNRIFVSKAVMKHSNDSVIVNIHIYNKNKKHFCLKLNRDLSFYRLHGKEDRKQVSPVLDKSLLSYRNKTQVEKNEFILKNNPISLNNIKPLISSAIKIIKKARQHKELYLRSLHWDKSSFKSFEEKYYKDFLKKQYKKQMLLFYYRKMLVFNNNISKSWFLTGLKSIISGLYKKRVKINMVNLKYLQLDTGNLVEAIAAKLRKRENRLPRVLKKCMSFINIPFIHLHDNSNLNKYSKKKHFGELFHNNIPQHKIQDVSEFDLTKSVLNTTKYKVINGVRVQAAGRLSKRLVAARSVTRYKQKGSLKDVDSSYKFLSSTLSRGQIKPNVQTQRLNSKTRIGAFGLKGWVSGI